MIVGSCWRVVQTKDKLVRAQGGTKMIPGLRFPSDHDFGFDINNPKNWQRFLEKFKVDGQLLPRRTSEGHLIAYYVYDPTKKNPDGTQNLSLFPGFTKEGKKLAPTKYGFLR